MTKETSSLLNPSASSVVGIPPPLLEYKNYKEDALEVEEEHWIGMKRSISEIKGVAF